MESKKDLYYSLETAISGLFLNMEILSDYDKGLLFRRVEGLVQSYKSRILELESENEKLKNELRVCKSDILSSMVLLAKFLREGNL